MRRPTRRQAMAGTAALAATVIIPGATAKSKGILDVLTELETVRARCQDLEGRAGQGEAWAWQLYSEAIVERDRFIDRIVHEPSADFIDALMKTVAIGHALLDDGLILDSIVHEQVAVLVREAEAWLNQTVI